VCVGDGERDELSELVHAATAPRPPLRRPCDECRGGQTVPDPAVTCDLGLGEDDIVHEVAPKQSARSAGCVRLSPVIPALSGHSIKFVNAFRLGIRRFRA